MTLRFRPRFTYGFVGSTTTITLSLPQKFWSPEEGVTDGQEELTLAGIPVFDWLTYEQAVVMRIRFTDDEYIAVLTFVEWSLRRKHRPITLRLEFNNFTTEYVVYMEVPNNRQRVRPARDTQDPSVWELEFIFRTVDGQRIQLQYFSDVPLELIPPPMLPASNYTFTSFRANWEEVPGANDYLLDVSVSPSFSSFVIHDLPVGTTLYVVDGLAEESGPYYYRLRSRFGTFVTGYSDVITATLPLRTFVLDTFSGATTGSNLEAHAGERGAIWTPHPTFACANTHKISSQGRVYGTKVNVTRGSMYFASGVADPAAPVAANYKVKGDLHVKSLVVNQGAGLYGRMDPVSDLGYMLWYDNITATRSWILYKGFWGQTPLGTFAQVLVAGNTYAMELRMTGNQIQVFIDGVLRINVTDATPHAGPGRAGMSFYTPTTSSDTTGFHIDNLRAESIG